MKWGDYYGTSLNVRLDHDATEPITVVSKSSHAYLVVPGWLLARCKDKDLIHAEVISGRVCWYLNNVEQTQCQRS